MSWSWTFITASMLFCSTDVVYLVYITFSQWRRRIVNADQQNSIVHPCLHFWLPAEPAGYGRETTFQVRLEPFRNGKLSSNAHLQPCSGSAVKVEKGPDG